MTSHRPYRRFCPGCCSYAKGPRQAVFVEPFDGAQTGKNRSREELAYLPDRPHPPSNEGDHLARAVCAPAGLALSMRRMDTPPLLGPLMTTQSPAEEAICSYELYVALHRSHRQYPQIFTMGRCTVILTAIMGGRPWSWRVVGITPAALQSFRDSAYKKVARDGITRAHIQSRLVTSTELIRPEEPFSVEEFARIWIENDKTVLCVRGENKDPLPDYISFADAELGLFRSSQIAWRHGKSERDYLVSLAREQGFIT